MLRTSDEEDSGASSIDPAHDREGPICTTIHNLCFQSALTGTRNFIVSIIEVVLVQLKTFSYFFFKSGIIARKRSTSKRGVGCSFFLKFIHMTEMIF